MDAAAHRVCEVCQSAAMTEDDGGALVCSVCGTQAVAFLAETNEAEGGEISARFKRARTQSQPTPSQPLPLSLPSQAELEELGDAPEAEDSMHTIAEAVQHVLSRQVAAVAALVGVEPSELRERAGPLWFRYLRLISPRRKLNFVVSLAICCLGAAQLGAPVLLARIVAATLRGDVPLIAAQASLPTTFPARLRSHSSYLHVPRMGLERLEAAVRACWTDLRVSAPVPDRERAARAVTETVGLPHPVAVAGAALERAALARRPPDDRAWMPKGDCVRRWKHMRSLERQTAYYVLLALRLCFWPQRTGDGQARREEARRLCAQAKAGKLPRVWKALESLCDAARADRLDAAAFNHRTIDHAELRAAPPAAVRQWARLAHSTVLAAEEAPSHVAPSAQVFDDIAGALSRPGRIVKRGRLAKGMETEGHEALQRLAVRRVNALCGTDLDAEKDFPDTLADGWPDPLVNKLAASSALPRQGRRGGRKM